MTIYASPTNSMRNPPWDSLSLLAISINSPWLFGGDLNSIIVTSENEGGQVELLECANISVIGYSRIKFVT